MHLSLSLLQNLVLCILWDIHQVYKNWVMRIGTNLRLALWSYLTFSFSSDACNFGKQCNVKRQIHPYNPHLFYHISVWQWGSLRHSGPQIPNSIYIASSLLQRFQLFRSSGLAAEISRQLFFKWNISASALGRKFWWVLRVN